MTTQAQTKCDRCGWPAIIDVGQLLCHGCYLEWCGERTDIFADDYGDDH